jgi:membrane-bound lytic murein transglycosylase D
VLPAATFVSALILLSGLTGCTDKPIQSAADANSQATAPALAAAPTPAAPPVPAQNPQQRKVQQLIAEVERNFRSGEAHYKKDQLTQAKVDFDRAVDLMLSSGLDIKAEPLLDEEYNRVVDAVSALEMEALKQGNGFAPTVEPSPADVANDVTFEVDPNLVAKARAELATTKSDLPLVINDYVAAYINFFANTQRGHNTLMHSFQRSGRYKAMIQRVLSEEGVPQDLIYLAVAESSFQPQAVNGRSGAGGMWQFMPHGQYGLLRNGFVDERFDPEKSTRAYARYMKFNYDQLGDWYLAMAAYDWGAGNVQRAVQKTGYADFWELYKRNNLPGETKNYVPEILAAIIIANNPKQYGFDEIQLDPPITADTLSIDYSIDLRLVADLVDAQPQDILALNPSILRLSTPPPSSLPNGTFDLHLPPGAATLYKQRVSLIPEDRRTQWRYHRVTPEDTLASVARSYRVSPEQLASVNQLAGSEVPKDGPLTNVEGLVIPIAPASSPASHTETYKARRGDTLITIADRFGVSLDELHKWNRTTGTTIQAGQRIRVSEPLHAAPHTKEAASSGKRQPGQSGKASKARQNAESASSSHGKKRGTAKAGSSSKSAAAAKSGKTSAPATSTKTAAPAKKGASAAKPAQATKKTRKSTQK